MEDVGRRSRLFSLDSLRGYNETHAATATDESLEDESSDVSFEDLSLRMREVGVQVDLGLTYPDLVSQVMRQYHLAAAFSTNTIGGLTYANFAGVEAVESIGLPPPNDRERALEEEEEENTMSCDSRRVSNTTVYEDIEDVVAYFEDDATEQDETDGRPGPPPLPPRRPEALTTVCGTPPPPVQRFMRKNLSAHLGLGQVENGYGGDITEAQRIDLENLRQRSESRKDLSRFLGLSEGVAAAVSSSSPVPPLAAVVKRPCRRLLAKNGANSRNSFIENILLGKVLKRGDNRTQSGGEETSAYQQLLNSPGSDGNSNTPAATALPTVKVPLGRGGGESNLNLRQRKLEHFFGAALDPAVTLRLDNRNEEEEQSSKSRSSSFSSTVSSSSSAASEPCSFSSSLSMGSASSSSCSVVRLFQPARFHSSLSSLRRSKSTVRRPSSVLPVVDNIRPEVGDTSREDISEFIERGMPVIPFSSSPSTRSPAKNRNVVPVTVDSTAERPLDRIGHSLDALIDFARHELRRSRERPVGSGSKGTVEAGAESLYMEMRAQPLPARQHAEAGGDTCDQLIPHQSQEQLIPRQLVHQQSEEQLAPPQSPEQLTVQIEEQLIPCEQEQLIAPGQEEDGEQMRRQERNQLISEVNQLDYMDMSLVRRVLALRDQ
jgi:hypothetical protein